MKVGWGRVLEGVANLVVGKHIQDSGCDLSALRKGEGSLQSWQWEFQSQVAGTYCPSYSAGSLESNNSKPG